MPDIKIPTEGSGKIFNFFTSVWIVPFVAMLVALWLVWQHFARLGPEVQIKFKNSGGLSAGQSVVRFRDVPVGKITRIEINSDGEGVIVSVRMQKNVSSYLNSTTRFWIVKPEVSYTGVKGLDTLFSGSYISMYAEKREESKEDFIGQDTAYRDINEGSYFMVQGRHSENLVAGTPVNYKNIQVGQIEQMILDQDGEHVNIVLFIEKKYDYLVNSTTKFWVDDLFTVNLGGGKAGLRMAPLSNLILGGISFETNFDKKYPKMPPDNYFTLYSSYSAALAGYNIDKSHNYMDLSFVFEGDISGLHRGSPVNYQGFTLGEVEEIHSSYSPKKMGIVSTVIGKLDIEAFSDSNSSGLKNIVEAINNGMRARITVQNPLTGAVAVDLYSSGIKPGKRVAVLEPGKAISIPSDPVAAKNIMQIFADLSAKAEKLMGALEGTVEENRAVLASALKSFNSVLEDMRKLTSRESFIQLPDKLSKTLKEFNCTLRVLKKSIREYGSGSLFEARVNQTLRELHESAEQTNSLLRKLNKKPNSLIFGE